MAAPDSVQTPLNRLVLFILLLSAGGSAVATAHFYIIDLPAHNAIPPANFDDLCLNDCYAKYNACLESCDQGAYPGMCAMGCSIRVRECTAGCSKPK